MPFHAMATLETETFVYEKKDTYFNYRDNEKGWQNGYCPVNDNRTLFEKSLLNIFVSPLHASVFHKIYPVTGEKNTF